MRKYINFTKGFFFLVPIFLLMYIFTVYFLYFDSRNDSFSIKIYTDYKENYAKSIKGRKILFVSGSNNFLGIRSAEIEKYFKIPTVNMAVHAGLTTKYILYSAKRVINRGDIVIVPMEYVNLILNGNPSIVKNQYILSYDREYFDSLDFIDKLKIISSISLYDLALSAYDGFSEFYTDKTKKNFLKHLNKNGDMLDRDEYFKYKTEKPLLKLPSPITLETEDLKDIIKFNKWCKANGVTFYMTYPNMIFRDEYKSNKEYRDYFNFLENYFKSHNIQTIGKPFDAMYPKEYFHDSEYHLNSKASEIRTKDFIELSKKTLLKEIQKRISN
jgi:hypothetical protein